MQIHSLRCIIDQLFISNHFFLSLKIIMVCAIRIDQFIVLIRLIADYCLIERICRYQIWTVGTGREKGVIQRKEEVLITWQICPWNFELWRACVCALLYEFWFWGIFSNLARSIVSLVLLCSRFNKLKMNACKVYMKYFWYSWNYLLPFPASKGEPFL